MNIVIPPQGKVIYFFGEDAQATVHMEECAELIQAISKMRRIRNSGALEFDEKYLTAYYNLVEEMADVLICIEQIQETYGISNPELQKAIDRKYSRTEARIHGFTRSGSPGQCVH